MRASGEARPGGGRGGAAGTRGGEEGGPSAELLEAGVYVPAPRRPLREVVADALEPGADPGAPAGEDEEAVEIDLAPLWERPELHARLVEAVSRHAADRRAGVVVALSAPALPLAAPAAVRLGLPLQLRPAGSRVRGQRPSGRPYLVAGILRPEDGPADDAAAGSVAGGCALVRAGGDVDGDCRNFLYITSVHDLI